MQVCGKAGAHNEKPGNFSSQAPGVVYLGPHSDAQYTCMYTYIGQWLYSIHVLDIGCIVYKYYYIMAAQCRVCIYRIFAVQYTYIRYVVIVDLLVEMWQSPWMVEFSRNSLKLSIVFFKIVNAKIFTFICTQSLQLFKFKVLKGDLKNFNVQLLLRSGGILSF